MTLDAGARIGLGCNRCDLSGFAGRRALYELLPIEESLKEAIARKATESELLQIAQQFEYKTMLQSGQKLVAAGLTTPSEVMREVGS